MKRLLIAAVMFAFFVSGIQAERWIVQFETGYPSAFGKGRAAFVLARNGVIDKLPPRARVKRDLGIINSIVVEADTAAELMVAGVMSVEAEGQARLHIVQSIPQIRADAAQEIGFTGVGVKVGIVDTGVDYLHPDIAPSYAGGYDTYDNDTDPMDEYYHGTGVVGILAAVAPEAELYVVKAWSAGPTTGWSYIIEGIEWMVDPNGDGDTSDHMDIINLSLGSVGTPDDFRCQAINAATAAGVTAIVSVGNWGYSGGVDSPGICTNSISVGATKKLIHSGGEHPEIAPWSSQGPALWFTAGQNMYKPDVVAPGLDICSARASAATFPAPESCGIGLNRLSFSGTSFSAPHVAGVAALIKQAHPEYGTEEIRRVLRATAVPFPYEATSSMESPYSQDAYGWGEIDAFAAVTTADPGPIDGALHPTAVYLGNISGSNPVILSYSGSLTPVTVEGYPVTVPAEVSSVFSVVIEVPGDTPSGLYQSRIHVGEHEAVIVFIVDREPPSVPVLIRPADPTVPLQSPLSIQWEIADDACIAFFRRSRPETDGTTGVLEHPISQIPEVYTACRQSISAIHGTLVVPDGEYQLFAEVTDLAGNITTSEVYTITIGEPLPPEPDPLVAPVLNVTVTDAVQLDWQDSNTDEDGFKVERDGVAIYSTASTAYTDSAVACGESHQYRVRAFRGEEFSDYSNAVSATLPNCLPPPDTTPPTVTILEPANGSVVPRRARFAVMADASDNVGVAFVRMTQGDSVCTDTSAPYSCYFVALGKPSAPYRVTVFSQDEAGNKSATKSITVLSESNKK